MAKFFLTKMAVKDLSDIWNYTLEKWSEVQADLYYNNLIETCKVITKHPQIGKSYEDIHISLQGFRMKRHILFYIVMPSEDIKIIRILHESMDIPNRLKETQTEM